MTSCEICKENHGDSADHPYLPKLQMANPFNIKMLTEHHNPLDIPFGHELTEAFEEGGANSGRHPETGADTKNNALGGELIAFETVSIPGALSANSIGAKKIEEAITKQILDLKLTECPCNKSHPK